MNKLDLGTFDALRHGSQLRVWSQEQQRFVYGEVMNILPGEIPDDRAVEITWSDDKKQRIVRSELRIFSYLYNFIEVL